MEFDANSVLYTRPELTNRLPMITRVRDVVAGEAAVKNKGDLYLPKLPGHEDAISEDYLFYLQHAYFYPATSRTAAGLRGLVFRKDPLVVVPEELEKYKKNITADGQSLIAFSKDVLMEVIQTNRCGLFVDFPEIDVDPQSLADVERMNIRPYVRMYQVENIINWRTREVNNETVTSLVVLRENIEVPDAGGFATNSILQVRVLYLDEEGVYHQDLYRRSTSDQGGMARISSITPLMNGEVLTNIPFFPVTDKGVTWDFSNPTLLALADTNLSHYRNSANRESALIWTGNPSPVFSGYAGNPDEGDIRIGSRTAIILQNGGSAQYLEFTGQGINPIKEAMQEKEEAMAVLGARIISPEKRTAETAESAMIHRAGEQGVLADIANSISDGLTLVMRFFGEYHKVADLDLIDVKLNTDFMPIEMGSDSLARLSQMYQARLISFETYVYALQRGEIIDSTVTAEEEYERIKRDGERVNIPQPEEEGGGAPGNMNRTAQIEVQERSAST